MTWRGVRVLSESETVRRVLDAGLGLARFGDGELALARGLACKTHPAFPGLTRRLREILSSPPDGCMVCIPRIYDEPTPVPADRREYWVRFRRPEIVGLLSPGHEYGSAFVSRPDVVREIDAQAYYEPWKRVWKGRPIATVGRHWMKHRAEGRAALFLEGAERVENIPVADPLPAGHDAFEDRERLLDQLSTYIPPWIVLMSLGPTATVLAADLAERGVQALDLGRLGNFYLRFRARVPLAACPPVQGDAE